jgi:CDP-glycerol glycerophosphotransferase
MYVKMDELPFSVARTNDELEQNILNFDRRAYLERLHNVYEKYGLCENGTASEKIVSMMCEKMKS